MDTGRNKPESEPMATKDDYLWDGSGEPDPEIQRLEALVGRFRYDRPVPVFPAAVPRRRWISFPWQIQWVPALAISAAVIAIVAGSFLVQGRKSAPTAVPGWDVSRLAGSPRIGRNAVTGSSHLAIGQVLETDQQSRASLRAEDTGQIEMEANSRLRLLNMGAGRKSIALDRGTIHTYIWAPPGQFVVETPSAVTVDLGCAYTLHVDDSGTGVVRTFMGWVGFKLNGHESFIPAGAACATRPKVGPGTPYFEDASPGFQAALSRFDFADSTERQRSDDLAIVVSTSRKRDALTLWHLLARVELDQRATVFDRLRALAPPPPGVTKEGILRLDQPMLDRWWNQLGFDDISVWRHWERSWLGASSGSAAPVSTK
jgi:hypothetical protein